MSESSRPFYRLSIPERWSKEWLRITGQCSIFTSEQHEQLLQALGREGETASRFLSKIEPCVYRFACFAYGSRERATPSRTSTLNKLQMIQRRVKAAHESLHALGPSEEYWWLVDRLSNAMPREEPPEVFPPLDEEAEYRAYEAEAMGRGVLAEDFLADLADKLSHLLFVMDHGLFYYRSPRRGRPQSFTEGLLIEEVAKEYAECFGHLPSSAKEGTFHTFILLLMEYAECPQADCSRILKRVIDVLKRKDTDEG